MNNMIAHWPAMLKSNWTEERYKAYEDLHLFMARRAAGELEVQRYQRKMDFHQQPVRTLHPDTPFISIGAPVQLENGTLRLAAEVDDLQYMASTSGTNCTASHWRSCFCLKAVSSNQAPTPWLNEHRDKSILHYGERVHVNTCNTVRMALTVQTLGGGSQHLLFFQSQAADGNAQSTHWQVLAVDPVNRDILMGFPVANGDSVILKHCLTGQLLCLEAQRKHTDFGSERLVTARTVIDVRRRRGLEMVKQMLPRMLTSDPVLQDFEGLECHD